MITRNDYIEKLLFSYFSGELSEEGKKELLAWLNANAENKKYLSEMADLWAIAHVPLFDTNMKTDYERRIGNLIQSEYSQKIKRAWLSTWRNIAVVVLLLMVATFSYYVGNKNIQNDTFAAFETIVPKGARTKILLPDRSIVWMNAGSSLKYTTVFGKGKREVWLNGEAYFEVEPDSLIPFIVNSEDINIKVRGTSFNVKAYQEEDQIDVTLITGKVDVYSRNSETDKPDIVLYPDQMLSYNKKTNRMKTVAVKASDACLWIDGSIKFNDLLFTKIAKGLERKYDVHILIESEILKDEIFSGSFAADYTLNDILKEIDVEKKYKWIRRGNNVTISDR